MRTIKRQRRLNFLGPWERQTLGWLRWAHAGAFLEQVRGVGPSCNAVVSTKCSL